MITILKIYKYLVNFFSKYWFVEIFKIFSQRKRLYSFTLNLLGFQSFRTWIAYKIKEINQKKVIVVIPNDLKFLIDENGYIKFEKAIKDKKQFIDLRRECKHALDNHPNRNYVDDKDAGYIWVRLLSNELESYPAIRKFLLSDLADLFFNLSIYNQCQKISFDEIEFNLHRVWTQKGYEKERNQELHTDIFHPSTKGWLFLDDINYNDGPLVFVPQSNRIDPWRLKFEYKSSLLSKKSSGSWRITKKDFNKKFNKEEHFVVKKNTMIVADTMGFHRRGDVDNYKPRDSIHFSVRKSPFSFF
ncbi:hypothetical protein OAN76_01060 [Candidatus Marinimicrobia bacterium]|nr:hypothetical protein [Candidatus Neomarinimicrobiota bacterium]